MKQQPQTRVPVRFPSLTVTAYTEAPLLYPLVEHALVRSDGSVGVVLLLREPESKASAVLWTWAWREGRVTGCKAQWPTVPQGYKEALAEAPEEDHRSRDLGMKVPGLQAQSVRAWPARDPSPGLQLWLETSGLAVTSSQAGRERPPGPAM